MRGFLRSKLPVANLRSGYKNMLLMMGGAGVLGAGFSYLSSSAAPSQQMPSKKSAERVWLGERRDGAFVSYIDMEGAVADQMFYRHNNSGTFVPDADYTRNFNAFMRCLIALELRNGSEFQYRLLKLQEMTDKAFLKDANRFLAAAAYDMGRARSLHMIRKYDPSVVNELKESGRVYAQSASVSGARKNQHLFLNELGKCREQPPRADFDPVHCDTLERFAKTRDF